MLLGSLCSTLRKWNIDGCRDDVDDISIRRIRRNIFIYSSRLSWWIESQRSIDARNFKNSKMELHGWTTFCTVRLYCQNIETINDTWRKAGTILFFFNISTAIHLTQFHRGKCRENSSIYQSDFLHFPLFQNWNILSNPIIALEIQSILIRFKVQKKVWFSFSHKFNLIKNCQSNENLLTSQKLLVAQKR